MELLESSSSSSDEEMENLILKRAKKRPKIKLYVQIVNEYCEKEVCNFIKLFL